MDEYEGLGPWFQEMRVVQVQKFTVDFLRVARVSCIEPNINQLPIDRLDIFLYFNACSLGQAWKAEDGNQSSEALHSEFSIELPPCQVP